MRPSAYFTILVSNSGYQDELHTKGLMYNSLKINELRLPFPLEYTPPSRFLPTPKQDLRIRLVA